MIVNVRAVPSASFEVADMFVVKDRGLVVTRPEAEARDARDRGELFEPGDIVFCGWMTATITGIESFRVHNAPQSGIMLRGVALHNLHVGQVWKRL